MLVLMKKRKISRTKTMVETIVWAPFIGGMAWFVIIGHHGG